MAPAATPTGHDRGMISTAALDPAGGAELMRLLGPLVPDLEDAARHPPAVAAEDWLGPASRACEEAQGEVRGRLGVVLAEIEAVLDAARRAL